MTCPLCLFSFWALLKFSKVFRFYTSIYISVFNTDIFLSNNNNNNNNKIDIYNLNPLLSLNYKDLVKFEFRTYDLIVLTSSLNQFNCVDFLLYFPP